jgi:hypothetical protein
LGKALSCLDRFNGAFLSGIMFSGDSRTVRTALVGFSSSVEHVGEDGRVSGTDNDELSSGLVVVVNEESEAVVEEDNDESLRCLLPRGEVDERCGRYFDGRNDRTGKLTAREDLTQRLLDS